MPITPEEIINANMPLVKAEIERATKWIDMYLAKNFSMGKVVTVQYSPTNLPISTELFIAKIEQLYRQAGWNVQSKIQHDQREGDWIDFTFGENTHN